MSAANDARAAARPRTRPFYWSVRRELWEHRAVYVAPLAAAGVALLGFLLSSFGLPGAVRGTLVGAKPTGLITGPYAFAALAVLVIGLLVAVFYCLGALHNERRDRSILFWKSLPVSDLVTVLAKAAVPLVVLPVVTFVVIFATHLVMLALGTLIVAANGVDPRALWSHAPVPFMWLVLVGGVPFIALWYAPLYAWLILVSAWARRAPFLWALGPPLALALVERMALGTTVVWSWLQLRIAGAFLGAFSAEGEGKAPIRNASDLDPAVWTSPHLWMGLALAAVFLAAAVRLRRSRDPI